MQEVITKEKVDKAYKPLKDFLKENYSLDLKVSEMNNIIEAVEKVNENTNELFKERCDVLGCDNNSDNGGGQWRETGYWMLCGKHWSEGHKGAKQPTMKPEAIAREKSRNSDGTLPPEAPHPFE